MQGFDGYLATVVERITDAFFALDEEWRFVYLNSEAERVLAREREDLLGKNVWEEFPEAMGLGFYREYHKAMAEQVTVEFEEYYPPLETWFEVKAYPSQSGLSVYFRDVTERKRTQEALRESEARYARIAANAPGMVYQFVLHPDGSVGFPYVSEGSRELYGIEPREIQQDAAVVIDMIHPEDRPGFDRSVEASAATLWPWKWEGRFTLRSGEQKWLRGTSRPQRQANGDVLWDGLLVDITERKRAEEALKESERRLRAVLDQYGSDIIMILNADGTIRYQSPAVERMLGYRPEELVGERGLDYLHPEDVERASYELGRIMNEPGVHDPVEYRFRHKDGSWRHLEGIGNNLLDDPDVRGIVINSRDITERKRAEEALEAVSRQNELILNSAGEGICGLDAQGNTTFVNPAASRMLGYEPVGRFLHEIIHYSYPAGTHYPVEDCPTSAAFKDGGIHKSSDEVFWRKDGTAVPVEYTSTPIRENGSLVGAVVAFRDITERKVLEERLEHQALHDPLMGLPNRTLFVDRLGHALSRAERSRECAAVLFLDLDNFKFVNDTLGHHAGDELLVAVSGRLRKCLRPADTAARLGGDEFAILLEAVESMGEAERVAERMIEELRTPFALGGQEVYVTPSIGITLGVPGQNPPEDLLREADVAMYQAKGEGKASHRVFDPGMEAQVVERLRLENDLRRALERDEFEVCYQPIIGVDTGRIFGMEALVRWEHPERGLVMPSDFVPLAEETMLIVPIGQRVLEEACRQAKEWQERYPTDPPLTIGVNLSARQLRYPDLVGYVQGALRESGLNTQSLTLEITESAVVGDEEHSMGTLQRIRGLGVRFALDDFGTGYSSLSYLKRLPVGLLKIDGSFVERLGQEPEDEILLSGVIGIASGLGMSVLAEGVETPDQLARLRSLGCDLAQGDYFSGPLSAEAAGELLDSVKQASSTERS